ncbi:hypothetical protein AMECASPLE_008619 [Ameca splendens]|uniref:Uncharacterized protein n=1 Tax=Ameca splendens TaxID=208324 RepID=A0ABV0XNX6_9TELE
MGTLQQESFIPKRPTKQHPHSTRSTHSPAPSTPTVSHPHHTACRDSKARAPHNAVHAPAHRHNRADTVEHRAHNGAPTPRRGPHTMLSTPLPTGTTGQTPSSTELTTEPPPQDGTNSPAKRSLASGKHSRPASPILPPQPHRHTTSLPLK